MNIDEVTKLQADRLRYLEEAYHESKGDPSAYVDWRKIGSKLGFVENYTISLMSWLRNEYYIEHKTFGHFQLTNSGIRVIEDAIKNPERSVGSFVVSYNSIHIDQMINSSIQQGTTNSSQNITIQQNDLKKINNLIVDLENLLKELGTNQIQKQDLTANIETIKAQTKSSTPRKSIIVDALSSISNIMQAVQLTRTVPPQIISDITNLLSQIS